MMEMRIQPALLRYYRYKIILCNCAADWMLWHATPTHLFPPYHPMRLERSVTDYMIGTSSASLSCYSDDFPAVSMIEGLR
jgi:hypothetical protein